MGNGQNVIRPVDGTQRGSRRNLGRTPITSIDKLSDEPDEHGRSDGLKQFDGTKSTMSDFEPCGSLLFEFIAIDEYKIGKVRPASRLCGNVLNLVAASPEKGGGKRCKATFSNAIFDGQATQSDAKLSGKGLVIFDTGDHFEGPISESNFCLGGTYTFSDGARYSGSYFDSQFDGKGTLRFENGDKYHGYFKQGLMDGRGSYTWNDNTSFSGIFKDGLRKGLGEMQYSDGSSFVGDFCNDEKTGKGKFTTSKGIVYEGDFKQNKRHGKGLVSTASGGTLKGKFLEGVLDGLCVLKENGRTFGIQFEKGVEVYREEI